MNVKNACSHSQAEREGGGGKAKAICATARVPAMNGEMDGRLKMSFAHQFIHFFHLSRIQLLPAAFINTS